MYLDIKLINTVSMTTIPMTNQLMTTLNNNSMTTLNNNSMTTFPILNNKYKNTEDNIINSKYNNDINMKEEKNNF
jgi:hypothetical protein